jgi:hypothetical protein
VKLWLLHVACGSIETFPAVCSLAAGNNTILVTEECIHALQRKSEFFERSVEHPFGVVTTSLSLKGEEDLTDLKANRSLKLKFRVISTGHISGCQ